MTETLQKEDLEPWATNPFNDPPIRRINQWGRYLTNLADAGLRSVARNNKATRLLTRPGQTTKSSAKDLSLRIVKLQFVSSTPGLLPGIGRQPAKVQGRSLFVSDYDV